MSRKLILTSMVLAGLIAGSALAEQIAYFPFSEGQGTETADATGNGNDGTLSDGVEWVAGQKGTGVHFDTAGERIVLNEIDPTAANNAMTLAAWINWEGQGHSIEQQGIIGKRQGWDPGTGVKWFWQAQPSGALLFRADWSGGGAGLWWGNTDLLPYANEWAHVAVTWDDGAAIQYINAEEVQTGNVTFQDTADDTPVAIGCVSTTNSETFVGIIDEVRIYDTALTAEQLQQAMLGDFTSSAAPVPPDMATDIPQDVMLSWAAGDLAVAHDVYFGTSFADVEAADRGNPLGVLVSEGQTGLTYDPPGLLDFGQSYYWRVDEVNAAPDSTIFKGAVWSFTVEPFVYPVENITVTASHAEAGSEAVNTVNGSGLDADDLHGISAPDMWLASPGPEEPLWIQYEFDDVYKLTEMWVWNYNVQFELVLGFGLKDVAVEYSTDGVDWTAFGDVEFAKATATADYAHNTTVDLSGVSAQYVRFNVNSGWGVMGQFGLSEVRFYYKPVVASDPQPASGQEGVGVNTALDWRSGREAAAHELYFSSDQAAVADGTALIDTLVESRYQADGLDLGATYYWKVNEVNDAAVPASWEGPIWDFSTQEFLVVEDFESYDDEDNRIYDTWLDGWINETGSTVGYLDTPFAETSIVKSGGQSMPLQYDNSVSPFHSEAEYDLGGQNWTANGADALRLYVAGQTPAFLETADGSILMNAIGTDIWDNADQFRYAYKQLTGDGSMVARVDALDNSPSTWAKAGVMIRQSTEGGSTHSLMCMTGGDGNGASWQGRLTVDDVSESADATSVVAPPYWVRIDRAGSSLTGFVSSDGETWTQVGAARSVSMADPVLIGLALTSHNANQATGAEFSNISTTGNVTGNWQMAEIGAVQPTTGNDVAPLYVAIEDNSGSVAVVTHPNPAAVAISAWQEWTIPLSDLSGINLNSVRTMYVGVGDRDNPTAGGTGLIFVDDILVGHPRP